MSPVQCYNATYWGTCSGIHAQLAGVTFSKGGLCGKELNKILLAMI